MPKVSVAQQGLMKCQLFYLGTDLNTIFAKINKVWALPSRGRPTFLKITCSSAIAPIQYDEVFLRLTMLGFACIYLSHCLAFLYLDYLGLRSIFLKKIPLLSGQIGTAWVMGPFRLNSGVPGALVQLYTQFLVQLWSSHFTICRVNLLNEKS